MKTIFFATALGIGLLAATGVYAADAPAGATAQCKDGTYSTSTTHKGACKGHQGVQTWLDKSDAAASSSKATTTKAKADTAASSKATSSKAGTAKSTAAASDSGSGTPIAKCKDGTTFNGTTHRGACKGHKGVDTWLDEPAAGGAAATPKTSTTSSSTTSASAKAPPPAAPASAPSMAPSATPSAAKTASPPTPSSEIKAQAGGGPGKVWVNSGTKVYHCQDDQWYGKTKEGSYMSEAQAKAGGNRAARGKDCGG